MCVCVNIYIYIYIYIYKMGIHCHASWYGKCFRTFHIQKLFPPPWILAPLCGAMECASFHQMKCVYIPTSPLLSVGTTQSHERTHIHTHTLVIVWQRMGAEQKCPSSHNNPDDAPHTYSIFMYHLTPCRGSAAIVMLECLIQPHQKTISDTSAQRPLNPPIHC